MISLKSLIGAAALACLATAAQAQVIGIATLAQGSLYYSVGAALAGVMQQKANISTRVVPLSGTNSYTPMINRGEIEFGLLNSADVANAYRGVGTFKGHRNPDLRLVGVIFPLQNGLAVPNDSPAKSIKDLKGLRIPSVFTAQVTVQVNQDAILATGGLSTADLQGFPVSDQFKGMQALGEGKVDVALSCFNCAIGKEVNVALASHGGMRFLPIPDTPEALAAMHRLFPTAYTKVFSPSPAFSGIVTPTRLFVHSAFLVVNKNVPEALVYKAVKAIHGSRAALVATSAALNGFDPGFMAEANIVPYHPGAEKFYKEIGQWPPKTR